ncbi:MAG: ABC transporter substrate-binding protein [Candidatus Muiribacteriota bacterium]
MKIKLLIITLFFILNSGCQSPQEKTVEEYEKNYGDILIQSVTGEPLTLNPLITNDSNSLYIQSDIFSSLVKSFKGEYTSELAEDWEITEKTDRVFIHLDTEEKGSEILKKYEKNKSDFKPVQEIKIHNHWFNNKEILEVIYKNKVDESQLKKWENFDKKINSAEYRYEVILNLRKNVNWHDDRRFTSGDVEFTYNYHMNPEKESPLTRNFLPLKKVQAEDRFTIKAVFYRPVLEVLIYFTESILPKHLLENVDNMTEATFNRSPVGTGPYKFKEWETDEYILLETNTEYYAGRPYVDNKMYRFYRDYSQQFIALNNGDIDAMSFSYDQYRTYIEDEQFLDRFNIFKTPSYYSYNFIGYNFDNPHLNNLNVRKALSLSINIDELIENIYHNLAERVTGPYRRNSWSYNKEVESVSFNPEKAEKLLKEEGYTKNNEGIYEKDGEILSFKITTNQDNNERVHMTQYLKDYWAKIGVKAEPELIQWEDYQQRLFNRDFDIILLKWILSGTPDRAGVWHSDNIPGESNPYGMNFIGYSNKKVDKLLEKVQHTPEIEKAKPLTREIHRIIASEYPYTFLFSPDNILVIDKRFKNVVDENGNLTSKLKWYVPEELIKYD